MSAALTLVDRVSEDTARARLERLLYSSVGLAALIYAGVLYPGSSGISVQTPQLERWYGVGLITVAIIMPAALGVLTWIMSRRAVRRLAGATALLFLAGMMTFPWGLSTPTLLDNATPWYQGIHALHGMIAAIAWQRRSIWVYGLSHGVVIGVVQQAVRDDEGKAAFLDGAGSLVFVLILMAATLGVMGAADRLDHASELARAQAARTAAGRTREREETRINAMVHDDIMSVLLTAARENPPDSLRDQARVAIASIWSLETRDASSRVYSNKETAQALVDVVERVAPRTDVVHQVAGDVSVPADVVTALCDALAEALRNSVRHAGLDGKDVPRHVTIAADDRGLVVTMQDEGKGFNTRAVQSRRLGISLSIIERMSMVEGGSGDVASRLGEGTTVTLTWVRPS
jgi:signal transduction histidine kinase